MRTHELMGRLLPLFDAVYDWHRGGQAPEVEQAVRSAWDAFNVEPMRKLLHCLQALRELHKKTPITPKNSARRLPGFNILPLE